MPREQRVGDRHEPALLEAECHGPASVRNEADSWKKFGYIWDRQMRLSRATLRREFWRAMRNSGGQRGPSEHPAGTFRVNSSDLVGHRRR